MAVEPFLGTTSQKIFMGTILIQAIAILTLIGLVFSWVNTWVDLTQSLYKTVPCYLALFALAEIFELAMGLDALRARNIIQVVGILIFHGALLIFAAIQVHETGAALGTKGYCDTNYVGCKGPGTLWAKVRPLLIAAPCVIGVTWISMIWCAKELYQEFGWAIFHIVGANPAMKSMYRFYQVIVCLLKFDFFCFTGVTMQLLILVLHTSSAEFGLTVAAIPVVLGLLGCAGYAVQREIKWLMSVSLVLMLAAESYFGMRWTQEFIPIADIPLVYKLVRFYEPASSYMYVTTRGTLTTFTIIAFVILLSTFIVGLRCFNDFDKGLLESKVHDINSRPNHSFWTKPSPGSPTDVEPKGDSHYQSGVGLEPRLSIE